MVGFHCSCGTDPAIEARVGARASVRVESDPDVSLGVSDELEPDVGKVAPTSLAMTMTRCWAAGSPAENLKRGVLHAAPSFFGQNTYHGRLTLSVVVATLSVGSICRPN